MTTTVARAKSPFAGPRYSPAWVLPPWRPSKRPRAYRRAQVRELTGLVVVDSQSNPSDPNNALASVARSIRLLRERDCAPYAVRMAPRFRRSVNAVLAELAAGDDDTSPPADYTPTSLLGLRVLADDEPGYRVLYQPPSGREIWGEA